MNCPSCAAELDPAALSCPQCRRLTRSVELEDLAKRATAAWRIGNFTLERQLWAESLALLPEDTIQHRTIQARLTEIDTHQSPQPDAPLGDWRQKLSMGAGQIGRAHV